MSGKFIVIPVLLGRHEDDGLSAFWQTIAADERLAATSPDKAIEILTLVRHIVNERLETGQAEPTRSHRPLWSPSMTPTHCCNRTLALA